MNVTLTRNELALALLAAAGGHFDITPLQFGNRFGLYRAMDEAGPSTVFELAATTGMREEHLATWLSAQARTGFLDRSGSAAGIRFRLNRDNREELLDSQGLESLFGDNYYRAGNGRSSETSVLDARVAA